MKLEKTPGGYALYKEKTIIGTCQARPHGAGRGHHCPDHCAGMAAQGLRLLPVKRGIAQPGRL